MKCDFYTFEPARPNFELDRDFIGTKLLTKFHEDRTINVASRVFTNKCGRTDGRTDRRRTKTGHKSSKQLETNVLTKFHENWAKNVTSRRKSPAHWRPCFSPIRTIVKLVPDINKTNVLTNFYDDWAKIVTSRVFTRENCHYIHIKKNAPPTGGHVFSPIWTIFELPNRENCHYIHIEKNAPPTGGHVFSPIWSIFELVRDIN
ncbi:hypothetical protein DPMN_090253 [Dreissena polymorpha]|uniref:Uncharacterized protein n=1 Tax=Dreissena polymorpha TaxID=45954 RepID=A0A9D4QYV4_DREPO|nr:hypothetical protein DPMN_090253 [Dreissena polymorpha]